MEESNEDIKKIIIRKRRGYDCKEKESAEIKMFLKNLFADARKGILYPFSKVTLISAIEEFLPIEYGEALDEFAKSK
mgnify:CR=1 FL=1